MIWLIGLSALQQHLDFKSRSLTTAKFLQSIGSLDGKLAMKGNIKCSYNYAALSSVLHGFLVIDIPDLEQLCKNDKTVVYKQCVIKKVMFYTGINTMRSNQNLFSIAW